MEKKYNSSYTQEQIGDLIDLALDSIDNHLKDIKLKLNNHHYLTTTDKLILLSETDLLLKIDRWLEKNDRYYN